MRWFLLSPAIEVMLRMAPPPACSMCGAASWQSRKTENRLSSKARRMSAIGMSKGLGPPPPALLTRMVKPPRVRFVARPGSGPELVKPLGVGRVVDPEPAGGAAHEGADQRGDFARVLETVAGGAGERCLDDRGAAGANGGGVGLDDAALAFAIEDRHDDRAGIGAVEAGVYFDT
jgi:hypothetical protein